MKSFKKNIPNILTFINLSLGVIAIIFAVSDNSASTLVNASFIIMVAAITDRFDGKVARALGVTSELGKELDSLSDLISFGVAPIIIAWKLSFINLNILGYIIAIIFPISGAYRLARYNINEFSQSFTGLPITIAGAFLTLINMYNCFAISSNKYTLLHSEITAFLTLLLSFLMISKFRLKKI